MSLDTKLRPASSLEVPSQPLNPVKTLMTAKTQLKSVNSKSITARIISMEAVMSPKARRIHLSSCIRNTPSGASLSSFYSTSSKI